MKREAAIQRDIRTAIRRAWPGRAWITKYHGNAFSERGVPDILGVVNGIMVGIEVKTPSRLSLVDSAQFHTLEKIKQAGGCGITTVGPLDAVEQIQKFLKLR